MAGHVPVKEALVLTLGADFVHKYQRQATDPVIPVGTTARIELYTSADTTDTIAVWNAVLVDDPVVHFRIESDLADLIPNRAHYRLYIKFPDTPTLDMCWMYGDVSRKQ